MMRTGGQTCSQRMPAAQPGVTRLFNLSNTLLPQLWWELQKAIMLSRGKKIFPWMHSQCPFTT